MTHLKRLIRSDAVRAVVCWLVSLYIRLVHATGRWTIEGGEVPAALHGAGRPFILAFWHGRLLMMPMAWDHRYKINMLISAHRDGRLIADAVGHFGIKSIAGSSSKGGSAALRAMVKNLRAGDCVGITPDGPRGPAMRASLGIVATARLGQVPIVPLAFSARPRRVLRSWDKFVVAYPFGRGVFLWGEPILVPADADEAGLDRYRRLVEDRLNALGVAADRRLGQAPVEPAPRADEVTIASEQR